VLAEVSRKLCVVELSVTGPEKSLRLRVHRRDDVLIRDVLVSIDPDARDSEATSLVDVEGDRELAVHCRRLRLNAREVIAVALVQRVSARDCLGDFAWIDRTSGGKGELLLHVFWRHPVGADHPVAGKNWTLANLDYESGLVGRRGNAAEDLDVVELTSGIERFDAALNVVDVELRAGGEPRAGANRGGVYPRISTHNYGFGRRAGSGRGLLGVQRSRARCDEHQHK
jgi:hypothetical protein